MATVLKGGQCDGGSLSAGPLRRYLRSLRWRLWLRGLGDKDTYSEIENHLLDAVEAGMQAGLDREAAEYRALVRFGEISTIVASFEKERQVRMQVLLLVLGAAAGLFTTYVDSRPGWDDTGITAGLLFLSAGALTLLGFRRPWLMGLAVGIWLPAYYILKSHDPMMLIILIIPLAGAYLGWAARWGFKKVFKPT